MEKLPSSNSARTDGGTVHLKKEIGVIRAVALFVGSIIGSGIFISPKGILQGANTVGMSLVVWLVCAVISTLGALCYVELGTFLPKAGGTYQYILHAYGDMVGFLVAWASIIIMEPAGNALLAITLGTYVSDYVIPGDCVPPREAVTLFAIVAVMLMVFINCMSVRAASGLAVFFCFGKVVALLIIIVTGIIKLAQGHTQYLAPSASFAGSTAHVFGYGTALYYGFWPFSGWDNLNNLVEEMKNPARNLPLAIVIGMPTVTVIYLLTNIAYFTTLSPDELLASSAVAVTFAERTLGPVAWLVPLGVCISVSGTLLGSFLMNPRIYFAAAREGHMLKVASMVNVKRLTPLPAIVMQGTIASILIAVGDFNSIIMYGTIIQWLFLGTSFMAVLVLRYKYPSKPRPFRVMLWVPVVATIFAVFMILAPVIYEPRLEYLYAFVLLGFGLFVYLVFVKGQRKPPFMDKVTAFLQKILLVSPPRY